LVLLAQLWAQHAGGKAAAELLEEPVKAAEPLMGRAAQPAARLASSRSTE